jgi:hypothetical protein
MACMANSGEIQGPWEAPRAWGAAVGGRAAQSRWGRKHPPSRRHPRVTAPAEGQGLSCNRRALGRRSARQIHSCQRSLNCGRGPYNNRPPDSYSCSHSCGCGACLCCCIAKIWQHRWQRGSWPVDDDLVVVRGGRLSSNAPCGHSQPSNSLQRFGAQGHTQWEGEKTKWGTPFEGHVATSITAPNSHRNMRPAGAT